MLNKGFTLIELIIVVAVIGVLALFAVPSYQNYVAKSQVSRAVKEEGTTGRALKCDYPVVIPSITRA